MKRPGSASRPGAALAAGAVLWLAGCLFQGEASRAAGTGVSGRFVDSAGRPLRGVRVTALPAAGFRLAKLAAAGEAEPADTALTDPEGRYAMPDLRSGDYNLVGEYGDGELAILVPDVRYRDSDGPLELGQDTLLAPGSIRGRIVWGGRGREGALAYLPGTSYLAVSDTDGAFLATGIPSGRYRVNYLVPGFQAAADTAVEVRAGRTTRLPDKSLAYDSAFAPPAPSAPRARVDTVSGVVRLDWDRVAVEDILGYLVYRDTGGISAPVLLTPRIHPDTSWIDSLPEAIWAGREAARVTYRIRSVDREKNPSLNFSPPLAVPVSRRIPRPTALAVDVFGLTDGAGWKRDTLQIVMRYHNPARPVRELVWSTDETPPRSEHAAVSGREGDLTRRLAWPEAGTWTLYLAAIDSAGDTTRTERQIRIVESLPAVFAGADTLVSIGDSVLLAGWDFDGGKDIVRREWDIGATGSFVPAAEGRLRFRAPDTAGRVACVYRVVDADGWQALDTLSVEVILDPPAARLSAPEAVFQGDTVRLSGALSADVFGEVAAWEWDIGDRGTFVESSGPDTAFPAGAGDTAVTCVLRVTDDDGRTSTARARIVMQPRTQWIKVVGNAPFAGLNSLYAWVFGGKAWVAGSLSEAVDGKGFAIWSSPDMLAWTRVDGNFDSRSWELPAPFQAMDGRIWGFASMDGDPQAGATVMSSADGATWSAVSSPDAFLGRHFTATVEFGGGLQFLGTYDRHLGLPVAEIWTTRDGSDFRRATDRAAFGNRYGMGAAVQGGRLWIYGGNLDNRMMDDVWSSADGIAWTRATGSALGGALSMAEMLAFKDDLLILGGVDTLGGPKWDVWRSRDGARWTRDPVRLPVLGGGPRYKALAFQGRLWLVAVRNDRDLVPRAEIWTAP